MKDYSLVNLYLELYNKVIEEREYISNNKDVDDEKLNNLIMKKRVVRDKIEKFQNKNKKILEEDKEKIAKIIGKIIELENFNQNVYENRLQEVKLEIVKVIKEKKIKDAYQNNRATINLIDQKK